MANEYEVIVIEDLAYFAMDFRKDLSKPGQTPFQATVAKYTDKYILFIINHSKSKENITTKLKIEKNGAYKLVDLLSNEEINVVGKKSQLTLNNIVNARDVKVLTIQPVK